MAATPRLPVPMVTRGGLPSRPRRLGWSRRGRWVLSRAEAETAIGAAGSIDDRAVDSPIVALPMSSSLDQGVAVVPPSAPDASARLAALQLTDAPRLDASLVAEALPSMALAIPPSVEESMAPGPREPRQSPPPSPNAAESGSESAENGALLRAAGIAGVAALLCKALGLVREVTVAGLFGVGPVVDGFSYASIVPGTFMVLLGGVNGPFHSAMASVLARRPKSDAGPTVEQVSTAVGLALIPPAVLTFLFAGQLIDLAAPGLALAGSSGAAARAVAVLQLQVMAPTVALSGLVGVGFGAISAGGNYAVPALAPALSSLAVMASLAVFAACGGGVPAADGGAAAATAAFERAMAGGAEIGAALAAGEAAGAAAAAAHHTAGGIALAVGVAAGSCLQWAVQAAAQARMGLGRFLHPSLGGEGGRAVLTSPAVREVMAVLLPATVASGMLQIATFTDLYFASFMPHAAAGLGYANLLAMAPLGVLSSALLLPALPLFARLSAPERWPELRVRVRQALTLAVATGVCLAALLVPNAPELARVVYQRRAFDAGASQLVGMLLQAYAVGAPAYLCRDVLVRAFYALGDGKAPFLVSAVAICANAVLDWALTRRLGLGAVGLVAATALVNVASAAALIAMLSARLGGLDLHAAGRSAATLVVAGAAAMAANWLALRAIGSAIPMLWPRTLALAKWAGIPGEAAARLAELAGVGAAAGACLVVFLGTLAMLRLPETDGAVQALLAKVRGVISRGRGAGAGTGGHANAWST